MKKFINSQETITDEELVGLVRATDHLAGGITVGGIPDHIRHNNPFEIGSAQIDRNTHRHRTHSSYTISIGKDGIGHDILPTFERQIHTVADPQHVEQTKTQA